MSDVSPSGVRVRTAKASDRDAVYTICLLTGDSGADATALYADPDLIGHIYAGPYVALTPQTSVIAEDDAGVCGYCVGAYDTRAYESLLEAEWWPHLRARLPDPGQEPQPDWSLDHKRQAMIHHPQPLPEEIVSAFPAHVHMNIHPRAQRRGIGKALIDTWCDTARQAGVTAVHAGVSPLNAGGARFWEKAGFARVPFDTDRAVWMGRLLG